MFIQAAYAEGAAAPQPSPVPQLILMAGMLVLFYFILWRPQAKQRKAHQDLMSNLNKGDEVVLSGGMMGEIQKVTDNYALLEIGTGTSIKVQKSAIVSALPKGTLKAIDE